MTNIYLELELHLDPPITGEDALATEIKRKIAEWNKMVVSNPKFSSKVASARKYIADGMPNCRDEAAIARSQKLDELRSAVQEQSMMGKITERGFTRLCELFPCFSEATVKTESGFVPEQLFRPPTAPPSLQCNRVIPAIEMESIQTDLLAVENGKYVNLYALLGGTSDTPRKTLHAKSEEELEKNRRVAVKSAEVNAKNRLYGKALNYFKDDYGQLDYDAALTRATFDQIARKKFQHRAINGVITMAIYKKSVADACEVGLTPAEAEWLVYEYYCIKMKCPPPILMEGSADSPDGRSNWIRDLKDLVAAWQTRPVRQVIPIPHTPIPTSSSQETARALAVEEPTILLESFQVGDIKSTVNPFDQYTLETVIQDRIFWQASALCALPMLIIQFDNDNQLSNFLIPLFWLLCALGFLLVVGRMFQRLILRRTEDIRLPIAAFLATLFIGVPLMLFLGGYTVGKTISPWLQFTIGKALEEAIKVIPVVFYLLYLRGKSSLKMAFSIGFLSSVGLFIGKILLAVPWFQGFLLANLQNSISIFQIEADLFGGKSDDVFVHAFPIFSLLIAHTIWTAIFTYYLFCAARAGVNGFSYTAIGLALAVLLHITYAALYSKGWHGFAAFIVAGSFVLFYAYLTQVRRQIVQPT